MSDWLLFVCILGLLASHVWDTARLYKKIEHYREVATLWRDLRSSEHGLAGEPSGDGYWHDEVVRLKAELGAKGERPL